MEMSPEVGEIAAALAKAQGALKPAIKDAENAAFKNGGKASRYADLASVWDACRDALSANGLAVIQSPGAMVDGRVLVTTILAHSSGQFFRETAHVPIGQRVDAHGYGSATTYARRYALAAMVGVAPEDDDGNAAAASVKAKPAAQLKKAGAWDMFKLRLEEAEHVTDAMDAFAAQDFSDWPEQWRDAACDLMSGLLIDNMQMVTDDELDDWVKAFGDRMQAMPAGVRADVRAEIKRRKNEAVQREAA